MTTIYLSSTYEDLKEHRRVVFDALRKSGYQVNAMEDYVATDKRPVDKCLKDVSEADIYVGIFAFRYGYVPPADHNNPKGLSITELEFRQAESLKKPCLTFVVNDNTPWPPKFDDARAAEDKGDRINTFRQYLLTEKLASSFSSPHELAALVLAAVTTYERENKKPDDTETRPSEAAPAITWDIEKDGSPYPGLMHFTRKYAPVFFGRDAEIVEVLDRLRLPEGRFLIISGGSGTGKSSLVDAGILPRIEETGIGGERRFVCVRMVPSQGSNPFDALLRPLHGYVERAELNVYELAKEMAAQPNILPERIQQIISKGMKGDDLILFLDQMEELFTSQNPEVSNKFLTALYEAAQKGLLRIIATIRSDHLHHLHAHPDMLRILRGLGHYPLGPVDPFMVSEMIVKPAESAGLRISETLARRIVHDTGTEAGNLPLLAFVLNRLFDNRADHELSETVYKTLGGVTGALAQHAASVETKIRNELGGNAFELLPRVFESLVIVKEDSLPTRRRPLLSDFTPEMTKLIDALVLGRLLQTEGEGKDATLSLTHEKLFDAWPSLRVYVETNKKKLMDQTLLESRARKWADMGKPWFGGLASGWERRELRRSGAISRLSREYLTASSRAQWIVRSLVGVVCVIALLFIYVAKQWQAGLSTEYALLKLRSYLMAIHLEPDMVDVKPGSFRMSYNKTTRDVEIQRPFRLGKYEVTIEEYDRFALTTGQPLLEEPKYRKWERGRRPIFGISFVDAQDYTAWLSEQSGKRYRLPSEAEWEYAARSGGKDEIWAGTSDEEQLADYAVFGRVPTYEDSPMEPVGSRKPNGLGLYDMSGNVQEWVQDCWHDTYEGAPNDGSAWLETGVRACAERVIRGGSWYVIPGALRTSARNKNEGNGRLLNLGFRLAQDLP